MALSTNVCFLGDFPEKNQGVALIPVTALQPMIMSLKLGPRSRIKGLLRTIKIRRKNNLQTDKQEIISRIGISQG